MTAHGDDLLTQVRFESTLAHLANALAFLPDDANLRASDEVDRLLRGIEERAAAA